MTAEESLAKMRKASNQFYVAATRSECHAFIEFTGLMNEYIKVCEANLNRGTDFRELNAHRKGQLQIQPYELYYIEEKLNCIFQGALEIKKHLRIDKQMQKHEILLNFTETEEDSISENCKCEFCGSQIRFYRHKRWISDGDYLVQNSDGSHHYPCNRPKGWSEFGVSGIPKGWEYRDSDNDDDRACFTVKKYSRFEK